MRILFCNYEYPPLGGGGGVVNALLAEELSRRHDVTVLTSRGPGLSAEEVVNGVRVVRAPVLFRRGQATASMVSMLSYVISGPVVGRHLLTGQRYDIVNTHFVLPTGPVGAALARRARIPNVLSLHGGDLYDPSKWTSPHRHRLLRRWVRRLLLRADAVVGQSNNTLRNMQAIYGTDLHGTRIPLGIRRPPEGTAARVDRGYRADEVLLVTVGRLVARKAVDQLIAVLGALRDPRVRLLVIGTGPREQELRRAGDERGLRERVDFLGHVPEAEKFRILRMCDLYVSTSQHEGFGLVFVEAMACGLPVLCYDHGGQTDFLEDGVTGALVPLNDSAAFAERVRALIADPGARAAIAQANRARAEELFIERCAARYEELFQEVITIHGRKHAIGCSAQR